MSDIVGFSCLPAPTSDVCSPIPITSNAITASSGKHNKRQSGFPGGSVVKTLPAVEGTRVQSLRQKDPLEKGVATHSSMPAWTVPQTEGPGELQSMGSTQSDATECLTLSLSYLLLQPRVTLACTGEPLTFTTALPFKTTPFLLTHSFLCVSSWVRLNPRGGQEPLTSNVLSSKVPSVPVQGEICDRSPRPP